MSHLELSVEHFGLASRDTAALRDWYVQKLGASVVVELPPAYFVRLGGLMIEIYEGDFSAGEISDNKMNGWRHLALRVSSIETAKAALVERGVVFTENVKPAGGGGKVLFFKDPDGNLLHLVERSPDSLFASGPIFRVP